MKTAEVREPGVNYEEEILGRVSRSFALTIPQLPPALRGVVTNAYLLCRIVDTIEDDESLPQDRKEFFFLEFNRVLEGRASPREFARGLVPLLRGGTLPEEKDLIGNTASIVRTTAALSARQQAAIKRCARIMSEGMLAFQKRKSLRGLSDEVEFHLYCYHVAGVVGEMLT
ncbi:MAG TPA: squalene/phytoene synthase family protein, partial [Thermodesulfobacteriota bacterium]|nr:squalene/phytoene synthase family protein [Thermodesulfobacteriota bacterium]